MPGGRVLHSTGSEDSGKTFGKESLRKEERSVRQSGWKALQMEVTL